MRVGAMDKLSNMLARLGLRGSSDDDGRRSAQSTPRLGRSRVRDVNTHQVHYGSMGSMENHRVRPRDRSWESEPRGATQVNPLHHSWDMVDHSAEHAQIHGLDRLWEAERARGKEMLQQSMEKQRHKHSKDSKRNAKNSKKKHKSRDTGPMVEVAGPSGLSSNHKLSEARLERRVDELNKQLLEEKQHRRKDKLALARLQQEVARSKTHHTWREPIVAELERERMLRVDTEQRLRDLAMQHDACVNRVQSLQQELQRKDELVRTLLQHKTKLDSMKQEKSSLIINYENNLQKCRGHMATLEQENKALLSEVSKLESQCGNCQICHKELSYRVPLKTPSISGEDGEKSRVLLERLRMLEEEKSSLVLENESQRQQYEKCLDEIANQVVQALMSQKSLREECGKLRGRVVDLEQQNRHLTHLFHAHFHNNSALQNLLSMKAEGASGVYTTASGAYAATRGCEMPGQGVTEYNMYSQNSLDSIYSLGSGEQDQMEGLGKAEMSSPPLWMKNKPDMLGSPTSSIASPNTLEGNNQQPSSSLNSSENTHTNASSNYTAKHDHSPLSYANERELQTSRLGERGYSNCPTEHVQSTLPKCSTEHAESLSTSGNSPQTINGANICVQAMIENTSRNSLFKLPHSYHDDQYTAGKPEPVYSNVRLLNESLTTSQHSAHSSRSPKACHLGVIYQAKSPPPPPPGGNIQKSDKYGQPVAANGSPATSRGYSVSPGKELLKLSDSFHDKLSVVGADGLSRIQNPLFSALDSDTESENPDAMTRSMDTSTVSLSELLDRGLEGLTVDDDFSVENFPLSDAEEKHRLSSLGKKAALTCSRGVYGGGGKLEVGMTRNRPHSLAVSNSASHTCQDYSSSGDSDSEHTTPTSTCANIVTSTGPQLLPASLQCKLSIVNHLSQQLNKDSTPQKKVPNVCASYTPSINLSTASSSMKQVKPIPCSHHQDSGIHLEEDRIVLRQAGKDSFTIRESGSSPDSAMQHSFSSSSSSGSEEAPTPQPPCPRDDGYSSNSTVSTSTDLTLHATPVSGVFIDSLGHLTPTPERPSVAALDFSHLSHTCDSQPNTLVKPHYPDISSSGHPNDISKPSDQPGDKLCSDAESPILPHICCHRSNVQATFTSLSRHQSKSCPSLNSSVQHVSTSTKLSIKECDLTRARSFEAISHLLVTSWIRQWHHPRQGHTNKSRVCQSQRTKTRVPQMGTIAVSAKSGNKQPESKKVSNGDTAGHMSWTMWGSEEDLSLTGSEHREQPASRLPQWQTKTKTKPEALQPTSPSGWHQDSSLRATAQWVHSQNSVPSTTAPHHLTAKPNQPQLPLSQSAPKPTGAAIKSDGSTPQSPVEEFVTLTQKIEELRRSVEVLDDEGSGSSVSGEGPQEEAMQGEEFSQRASTSTLNAEDGGSDLLMNLSSSSSSSSLNDHGKTSSQQINDVSDPQVRADLCDKLFDVSSGEDDDGDEVFQNDPSCKKARKKKTKDKKGAIRHSSKVRPSLEANNTFSRYDKPEKQALDSFSFLTSMFSTTEPEESQKQYKPDLTLLGNSPTSALPACPIQNKVLTALKEASRREAPCQKPC